MKQSLDNTQKCDDCTLFYHPQSSCSMRVLIALRFFELEVNLVELQIDDFGPPVWKVPNSYSEINFSKLNPEWRVPCLIIGEKIITQSGAILDYFHDRGTINLIPEDIFSRVKVRQICDIVACDIQPLQNIPFIKLAIDKYGLISSDLKSHPLRLEALTRGFLALDKVLEKTAGEFSVGDRITFADFYVVGQVRNTLTAGVDITQYPYINSVWINCLKNDLISQIVEDYGLQQVIPVKKHR